MKVGDIKGLKVTNGHCLSHLIFVDDEIILGNESVVEWRAIKELMSLFCSVLCLTVSNSKSAFSINCSDQPIIDQIALCFLFQMNKFEKRINYLGYFLKPNNYLRTDWNWIVVKFYRKIVGWTSR